MFNKVQVLLSLSASGDVRAFAAAMTAEGEAALKTLPKGCRHRRAVRLPGDPTTAVPQDGHVEGGPPPPSFDGFLELGGEDLPFETFTASLTGLSDRLGTLIDPASSAVVAGTEHVIMPGSHKLFLVMALRRLPKFSRADFADYWGDHHASEVSENVSDLPGYRQFHADEEASQKAAKAAGLAIDDFDGTAEGYYRSMDEFLEIMARPEVAADAGFIDHSRTVMWLYDLAEERISA